MEQWTKDYLSLVTGEHLQGLNLTNLTEFDDCHNNQTMDAYTSQQTELLNQALSKHQLVIDLGFGGGFPLLPLAKLNPQHRFLGIDARAKKVRAVQWVAQQLNLSNVQTVHGRMEDFLIDQPALVLVKGVGNIAKVLGYLQFSQEITVIFYKGPQFYQKEAKEWKTISEKWSSIGEVKYHLPRGEERLLIGVKPKNVPRGTSSKQKNLISIKKVVYG